LDVGLDEGSGLMSGGLVGWQRHSLRQEWEQGKEDKGEKEGRRIAWWKMSFIVIELELYNV
jgi:hypothetical protein